MRAVDIIIKKRDHGELSKEEIQTFVDGFTRGDIPDYQVTAWAMAVLLNGMTPREAYEGLLEAYAEVSSFRSSFVRGVKTFRNTRSLFSTGLSFSWNYQAYTTIRNTQTPLAMRD